MSSGPSSLSTLTWVTPKSTPIVGTYFDTKRFSQNRLIRQLCRGRGRGGHGCKMGAGVAVARLKAAAHETRSQMQGGMPRGEGARVRVLDIIAPGPRRQA